MLIWIVLATLGRIAGSCLASIVQKRLFMAGQSSTVIVAISISLVAIMALVLEPAGITELVELPAVFWKFILISALLDTFGNVLLVHSVGAGELSIVGPLNSYKPLIATLLGIFILQEVPSVLGIFGMVAILLGSWLLIQKTSAASLEVLKQHRQAVAVRMGSIALTSVASIFLKSAIESSSVSVAFQVWAILSAGLGWLVVGLRKSSGRNVRLQNASHRTNGTLKMLGFEYLLLGCSLLVMQWLTVWLFSQIAVGYALALFQLASLVQVGLGKRIFCEQQTTRRMIAALVMSAGAMLVLLSP
jgi:drug/metabolite transporter (DMT)-like permease